MTNPRIAVVVLATGEYWKGAKVLFYTLRKYGKLPDWVDKVVLGLNPCDFAEGLPIGEDYSWIPVSQKNFPKVADKFFALTLDYDRIIMMDADMLCVGDCGYLWSDNIGRLAFYACRDTASAVYYRGPLGRLGLDPQRLFNAGTMIFHPSLLGPRFLEGILAAISDGVLKAYDGGDQGYLNYYFQKLRLDVEVGCLPSEYNSCTDQYMPRLPYHARRIIHFTGRNANPWCHMISRSDWRWPLLCRWEREWEECSQ